MDAYQELNKNMPFLKTLFREKIAIFLTSGLKGLREKAGNIADKTVDVMAADILDEVLLERSSRDMYKAANMAALRMEMERVKNHAIEMCMHEAAQIMQAFDRLVQEAALEAAEEAIQQVIKAKRA